MRYNAWRSFDSGRPQKSRLTLPYGERVIFNGNHARPGGRIVDGRTTRFISSPYAHPITPATWPTDA